MTFLGGGGEMVGSKFRSIWTYMVSQIHEEKEIVCAFFTAPEIFIKEMAKSHYL